MVVEAIWNGLGAIAMNWGHIECNGTQHVHSSSDLCVDIFCKRHPGECSTNPSMQPMFMLMMGSQLDLTSEWLIDHSEIRIRIRASASRTPNA